MSQNNNRKEILKQKMGLIIQNKNFQKDIFELRKKLSMPIKISDFDSEDRYWTKFALIWKEYKKKREQMGDKLKWEEFSDKQFKELENEEAKARKENSKALFSWLQENQEENVLQLSLENEILSADDRKFFKTLASPKGLNKLMKKAFNEKTTPEERSLILDANPELYQLHYLGGLSELREGINKIIKKYKLPEFYKNAIKAYLIFNDFEFMPFLPSKNYKIIIHKDEPSILIKTYPFTTSRDLREAYSEAEKLWEGLGYKKIDKGKRSRIKKLENFERDLMMVKLKEKGLDCRDIMKIINLEFPEYIIGYERVSEILSNFKEKIAST